jgi:hypothetical protein
MFISMQHPFTSNSATQTDAAGNTVVFNTHTTLVIARSEFLGAGALPVKFTSFEAKQADDGIQISWSTEQISNHSYFSLERSSDGIHFAEIYRNNQALNDNTSRSFSFTDKGVQPGILQYYRIKQCGINGECHYSVTKSIKLVQKSKNFSLFPVPVKEAVHVLYYALDQTVITLIIVDEMGRTVHTENKQLYKGENSIYINTRKLTAGNYTLMISDGNTKSHQQFTKS